MTEVAHLVLARKYRPRVFKEVVEQGLAVTALKNAADHGRIGSAYLFSGARGTGKTTIARILAKRVNCLNPKDSEPCCECESCVSIQNGSSLDVQEIDAASNRSIDNIRDLRENVKFQPMNAKRKVYIIDEVHMLTPEAFNALLKTLEEPPEHVLFVLATTELNKIPETILSRCQTFAFRKVPLNILQNHLKDICNREKIKAEDEALFWIARRGDGSVRDSLSFLEQSITYTEGNVTTGKVKELIGALPLDLYLGLIQMLLDPKTKFPDLVGPVHRRFDEGADLRRFIWDFLDLLRALSHVLHGVERPEFVGLPPTDIARLKEAFASADPARIQVIFDAVHNIMTRAQTLRLENSYETRVLIEMELLRLHEKLGRPSLSFVLRRLDRLANAIDQGIPFSTEDEIQKTFLGTMVDPSTVPVLEQ